MSNPRIPHRMPAACAPLAPLGGKTILVHVVVNVEHWPFDQPMPRTILTPPHGKESVPDIPNFTWAEYGLRRGLPRMIEALATRGLPASASLNASVIASHPQAADAIRAAGWEFIGHGLHQRTLTQGGASSEAEVIQESLRRIEQFTGVRPQGWLSPGLRETGYTPEVLRAAGVRHVFDWCLDDLPNWMVTREGPLLSLPYTLELNDSVVYAVEKHSSPELRLRVERTLAQFARETATQGEVRVLTLGLHPHLIGVPHRIGDLQALLDLLAAHPQVGFVTGSALHDWYAQQVPAPTEVPQ